jgi:Ca-activated chloride channel family protein
VPEFRRDAGDPGDFLRKSGGTAVALAGRRTGAIQKTLAIAAVAITMSSAAGPLAQAPVAPPQSFQSGVNLVALNVTVQDGKAQYVKGLTPSDFAVYEDGVQQDVRFFETEKLPIDLMVLVDTSRSMSDKLHLAQAAARGFFDTLRPGDRGAVVSFNDTVRVLEPLTCDTDALDRAIDHVTAGGNTSLHNAIYIALKQFGQRVRTDGAIRRQALAVLSDGEDTSSLIAFEDVLALARQMGVNIYTLRLQVPDLTRDTDANLTRLTAEADYEMKTLARETGALSFFPAPEQLDSVYGAIAKDLANQYSIGYEAGNGGRDGRFRRVQVQVVRHPELRARTRVGYTADGLRATTVNEAP